MAKRSEAVGEMLKEREVIICVGSGGVGKTTSSAVIGLEAAMAGRKVLVLTIDPARRLANSLGIEAIGSERQQIPLERFRDVGLEPRGEMWAMMLDMKECFDRLVQRHAPDEETAEEILENRFYHYFSTSVAGTQEYAASERLHELYESGEFDLIVLDTPPTTHALDFLEAPQRLADAVSSRALQWLHKPGVLGKGSRGRGLLSMGTNYASRVLSKFTGSELIDEMGTFLKTFSTLFEGFEERARSVQALLGGDNTGFVVVTAPDTLTVEEALFFYDRLDDEALHIDGFVVNKVHPRWVSTETLRWSEGETKQRLEALAVATEDEVDLGAVASELLENARQFDLLASQDQRSLSAMEGRLPRSIPIAKVPYFNQDIHSLGGLDRARQELFGAHH